MNKAQRTRQFIVEKTAPIFNVKGFAGTSLSDMTEATGLTKGSIYGNFANKDEVATAAFEYNWSCVQEALQAEMAKRSSARDKLLGIVRVYGDLQAHSLPRGGCPLLNTAVEADDTHLLLREQASEALQGWKKNLVSLIEAGIQAREFRADVDAEHTALTLIALIEGGIMISRLTGNVRHRKAVMSTVEKTIFELA
ncbi:MAG TPA: TetR/AcrR family transcriptional regulator [Polyangiaceae bacterium]|nr:TetR/AcrR family transcriptional regulator [Polyangiaceae bacterium]